MFSAVYVKSTAKQAEFVSAAVITDDVITKKTSCLSTAAIAKMPSTRNIAKAANRFRQQFRPKHPQNLNPQAYVPSGFPQADLVTKTGYRHLVFATDMISNKLSAAENWYGWYIQSCQISSCYICPYYDR